MAELNLPVCPICEEPDSLFRQTRELKGTDYTWYECRACASVLLWVKGGLWTYQKVGRDDKAHLLKQPLTVDDLEALLPQTGEEDLLVQPAVREVAEQVPPAAPAGWEVAEEEPIDWEVTDEGALPEPASREAREEAPAAAPGWEVTQPELHTLPVGREVGPETARVGSLPTVTADWDIPDLQAEAPTVTAEVPLSAATAPTVTVSRDAVEELREEAGERQPTPRLFVWLVGVCLVVFVVLVAVVIYQLAVNAGLL